MTKIVRTDSELECPIIDAELRETGADLVLLPDGTFVSTTYVHWDEGQPPYVVSVRFRLEELDQRR